LFLRVVMLCAYTSTCMHKLVTSPWIRLRSCFLPVILWQSRCVSLGGHPGNFNNCANVQTSAKVKQLSFVKFGPCLCPREKGTHGSSLDPPLTNGCAQWSQC